MKWFIATVCVLVFLSLNTASEFAIDTDRPLVKSACSNAASVGNSRVSLRMILKKNPPFHHLVPIFQMPCGISEIRPPQFAKYEGIKVSPATILRL